MKRNSRIFLVLLILVMVFSSSMAAFAQNTGADVFAKGDDRVVYVATTTGGAVDSGEEEDDEEDEPDPVSISIQSAPSSMEVGDKESVSYKMTGGNGDEKVVWNSSDTDVISVNNDGRVTANAPGNAEISVEAGDARDSVVITVEEVKAESIEIISDDFNVTNKVTGYTIKKGETIQLDIKVKPKEAEIGDVSWSVDDANLAEIDDNGLLTALEDGEILVTAEADDLTTDLQITIKNDINIVAIIVFGAILLLLIILLIIVIRKWRRNAAAQKAADAAQERADRERDRRNAQNNTNYRSDDMGRNDDMGQTRIYTNNPNDKSDSPFTEDDIE